MFERLLDRRREQYTQSYSAMHVSSRLTSQKIAHFLCVSCVVAMVKGSPKTATASAKGTAKVTKQQLAAVRASGDKMSGNDRKAAIQNMTSWLRSNASKKQGTAEGKELEETLKVYQSIEDTTVRDDFLTQFYKARTATGDKKNSMSWAAKLIGKYNESEQMDGLSKEGFLTRSTHATPNT